MYPQSLSVSHPAIVGSFLHLTDKSQIVVGRFAPSPSGRMHAGNIYAALMSWLIVKSLDGSIVLRIDDLDTERSKKAYIDAVQHDFEMLGLTWDVGPIYQHDHTDYYRHAITLLEDRDLVYPCFCSRADLHAASAPHKGEKLIYPGTCRTLNTQQRERRIYEGKKASIRLITPDKIVRVNDLIQGPYQQNLARDCGDFVICRADKTAAYQLAVVIDDALQGINMVVRGVDLLDSTPQQIYLAQLLNKPIPLYAHVPLIVDDDGRRLSKRNRDASLEEMLLTFKTPEAIIGYLASKAGIIDTPEPCTPEELLTTFSVAKLTSYFSDLARIKWEL